MEEGFIRIPGCRPIRKNMKKNNMTREQQWDNRFILGKIPEYHRRPPPMPKKNIVLGPGRIRKLKETDGKIGRSVSEKGIDSRPPSQRSVQASLERLHELWEEKRVENQFRQEFLKAIDKLPIEKMNRAIRQEYEELQKNQNVAFLITQAVEKREAIIRDLKELETSQNIERNAVIEGLNALRIHSVHIVESIKAWRDRLKAINPKTYRNVSYTLNGDNYLLKMREDTGFLTHSCLEKFFEFSSRVDPFLVSASNPTNRKIELPIAPGLMKRVKACEATLLDESVSSVINDSPKDNRQRKPTPKSKIGTQQVVNIGHGRSESPAHKREIEKSPPTYHLVEAVDLFSELHEYATKVPDDLKDTLGPPENAYAAAMELRYPAFLWVHLGKERLGLLVINLEVQKTLQKRLHITHLSSTSLEVLPEVLVTALDYIWETYPCVEIRIGLVSKVNSEGKYETDKSIKQHFDALGFRWKQLLHSKAHATPLQLLGLRRPEDKECLNTQTSILFDDCLSLSYACVLQVDMSAEDNPPVDTSPVHMSAIGIGLAMKTAELSCPDSFMGGLVNKIQSGWVPPAFRFRKDQDISNAARDLQNTCLMIGDLEQALETTVTCAALGLSWGKFFIGSVKGKPYTKVVETEISVMANGEQLVYLVPTEDQQFSAFFIPYSGNVHDPFAQTKNILSGVNEVKEVRQEIWIPDLHYKQQGSVQEITGKGFEELSVSNCLEAVDFRARSCRHPRGSVEVDPSEDELVLAPPLLCGFIHSKLEEELEVPYLVIFVK